MIHIAFYWLYFEINSSCVLKVIESIRDEQMKKFHDISMIFPGFFKKAFQVYFQ